MSVLSSGTCAGNAWLFMQTVFESLIGASVRAVPYGRRSFVVDASNRETRTGRERERGGGGGRGEVKGGRKQKIESKRKRER